MAHRADAFPDLSRRRFLGLAAAVPAALVAASAGGRLFGGELSPGVKPVRKYPIGLELYAVRSELARDLPGTLQQVAAMGYEVVEFYAPYFQWTPAYAKDVRAQLDRLGLRCLSTHNHLVAFAPGDGLARAMELNEILGSKYLILASAGREPRGADGWRRLGEQLTTATRELNRHGLTAGFHNHQTEWARVDGDRRIMDLIAENTPQEFALQFDVGTCMEAGADPVAWIKANPGRIRSIHLKDWAPGKAADEKDYRVLFGEGVTPWQDIIAAAESGGGVEYYLMEQEGSRYPEFDTARRCLETWRRLRGAA